MDAVAPYVVAVKPQVAFFEALGADGIAALVSGGLFVALGYYLGKKLDDVDQIREVLIHGNYMSQREVDFCRSFSIENLRNQPGAEGVDELHGRLFEMYPSGALGDNP